MFEILPCTAVLLSGVSIILFGIGQEISFSVKEDYEPDRYDIQKQKRAILILTISYVILLAAAIVWGATFFFMH